MNIIVEIYHVYHVLHVKYREILRNIRLPLIIIIVKTTFLTLKFKRFFLSLLDEINIPLTSITTFLQKFTILLLKNEIKIKKNFAIEKEDYSNSVWNKEDYSNPVIYM